MASEDVAAAQADDHVAQVEAADLPKLADHAVPSRPALRSASLLIIASLAVVYTLYFGKELLLPMTLALLFKLLLQAPMRFLTRRLRLPDPVAALAMILAVFGCVALVALTVSVPASGWVGKAPASLPVLQAGLTHEISPINAQVS